MPVVIIGLVAAALTLTVILLRGKRRAVTSQKLEVLAQERERQNEEALEGDADAQICLLDNRLNAAVKRKSPTATAAEKESTPIDSAAEIRNTQNFVLQAKCQYVGEIKTLTKFTIPRQDALIKRDMEAINNYTLALCGVKLRWRDNDASSTLYFCTATRKSICLHQSELRIVNEYTQYIVDVGEPTYFRTLHVEKEDVLDGMEEHATVRELFEQVIFYRIRDQTVSKMTEELLNKFDQDISKGAKLRKKLDYKLSQANKFDDFLTSSKAMASSYIGGWEPKVTQKGPSQGTEPTDDMPNSCQTNNSDADSSDSVEENPNED